MKELEQYIFNPSIPFDEKCIRVFEYQKEHVPVYKRFCEALGISQVLRHTDIPLLPIQAFKDAKVVASNVDLRDPLLFQSSGTTAMTRSQHVVANPDIYRFSILRNFERHYDLSNTVIWAYTPGYNDNPHSSLIWMLKFLIDRDTSGLSRFLPLSEKLPKDSLDLIVREGKQLMIFGAAFGLIDLAEQFPISLPETTIIMETGGMKTHRREMTRDILHRKLASSFNLPLENVHSEYGMTELLSQAYSTGDKWFETPLWMSVSIRNPEDPTKEQIPGEEGLIGIIDLANMYSCSFILTGDKGVADEKNRFQILGRWNAYNLRGCNFLIDQD